MNLEQFFEELSKIDGWYIHQGKIRRRVNNKLYCPITAVVERLLGKYIDPTNYLFAAIKIGMPAALADRIAVAANNQKMLLEEYFELRKKLEYVIFPKKGDKL